MSERRLRALIVADDTDWCLDVQEHLELENFQVMLCQDSAVRDMVYHAFMPDFVILIGMYDVEFNEVFTYFVEYLGIPTLVIAKFQDRSYALQTYCRHLENVDCLQTPFRADEMMSVITELTAKTRSEIHWLAGKSDTLLALN